MAVETLRRAFVAEWTGWDRKWRDHMVAAADVLADLARTGWTIEVARSDIYIQRPVDSPGAQREQHRRNLTAARSMQLLEPSVKAFVAEMERPRPGSTVGSSTIFSLMRDGRDLARNLLPNGKPATLAGLLESVKPYLVFVDEDAVCSHTGLRLMDVWRYFRHTWTNPYQSVPGRSTNVLVRDAAAPGHPVMGIGAISSAAVQMTARDRFIGWQAETFVEWARASPSDAIAEWADRSVRAFIDDLYLTDFIQDEWFTFGALAKPGDELISRLGTEAARARAEHQAIMQAGEYKKRAAPSLDDDEHWKAQTLLPLFRGKRAAELAALLQIRQRFTAAFGSEPDASGLERLLADAAGAAALGSLARKAKAKTVGVNIADLTVCGAIAPYNELLGGKLVAMLAASPQMVAEYGRRYSSATSIIASSMAGRAIRRRADLVFLATTSLYGVRPSQYDNIGMPCDRIGGRAGQKLRYVFLENTQGKGSFHFSDPTVDALAAVLRKSRNGLTVNSVFGEGSNPKLRKLRGGFECLGLPAEELITHGIDKLVYVVPLVRNARDFLLGLVDQPDYLFGLEEPAAWSRAIAAWWAERWVLPRLNRPDLPDRLAKHTLALPVRHGARVILPDAEVDAPPLFDW